MSRLRKFTKSGVRDYMSNQKWVGQPLKRLEDKRLLTGVGTFVDDLTVPKMHHGAILRSPYAHAKIISLDASKALELPGVVGVLTGQDVLEMSKPFVVAISSPQKYYSMAIHKVRFVGEPVAVVVAVDKATAEDALELISVDYEALKAVVDPEKALSPDAPLLHEEVGTNAIWHRTLNYGEPERVFGEADFTIKERFVFPKYSSTPMETYAVIASYNPTDGVLTIWSNFHGPWTMFSVAAKGLKMPEEKLRLIVPPDIGGGFGIKSSAYPYLVLMGLASMKTGVPVKWIEDRREHLLASSSGTDRISYVEAAVMNDGTITALKLKTMDNVGAYVRAPEPGCTLRPLGNYVGAYKIQHLSADVYCVSTNKMPTGPNRGYGCQQHYFGLERIVDMIAQKLNADPAEIRLKNFIQPEQFPYTTPTGGIYDSGDYPATLKKAMEIADYANFKEVQKKARDEGRYIGLGMAIAVDPSVSNMGYVTVAFPPEVRAAPGYLPKSGGTHSAAIKVESYGKVNVTVDSNPQGQGHETVVSMIVADELGLTPEDVNVVAEFDSFTRLWSIPAGTYSSRFGSVGTSAVAGAARKVRKKMLEIAAHHLKSTPDELDLSGGKAFVKNNPDQSISFKRIAGMAHWAPELLPKDMEPGLNATCVFNIPTLKPPDEKDRVNSSGTYGVAMDIVIVEVMKDSGEVKILKYVSVHDAGTIINPLIVEGQIYGSVIHGIGGALYEELVYDDEGQMLTGTFIDYLCVTSMEAVRIDMGHIVSPSPFTTLGSKGVGESSTESCPVAIAAAIENALSPFGVKITELPATPEKMWKLMNKGRGN